MAEQESTRLAKKLSRYVEDCGQETDRPTATSSQTLLRGLDILEAIAAGHQTLASLATALGTTRSTTHRLALALVERRFINFVAREGYSLGPKLLELGFKAQQDMVLPRVARPYLERLSEACEDTIHLGVLEDGWALYLDKIPGRRRVEINSRVGERHPVWSTGLGKALILDLDEASWRNFYGLGHAQGARQSRSIGEWLARMREYAKRGIALDLEENEAQVLCVAAPIRDASTAIVAAFSVSSTVAYMDQKRIEQLGKEVKEVAQAISRAFGWTGPMP